MPNAEIPLAFDVRTAIASAKVDNPSLLLDKYCRLKDWPPADNRDNNASSAFLKDLCKLQANNNLSVSRATSLLSQVREQYGERSKIVVAKLEGRLAIDLADGLIQNAGIRLDRLTGVPFIPGSAVKGVARNAAVETGGDKAAIDTVFGSEDCKKSGSISFLPAYPLGAARLVVDITNVHYAEYYKTGNVDDLKVEKCSPNPFPTVEKGAQFVFCLIRDNRASASDLDNAEKWLKSALEKHGIGAKTAAGYGWFSISENKELDDALNRVLNEREEARKKVEARREIERQEGLKREAEARKKAAEEARLAAMSPEERRKEKMRIEIENHKAEFIALGKDKKNGWPKLDEIAKFLREKDESTQRALLELLQQGRPLKDHWTSWKKEIPDTGKVVRAVSQKLNIKLP